jgi:hypothetical protein
MSDRSSIVAPFTIIRPMARPDRACRVNPRMSPLAESLLIGTQGRWHPIQAAQSPHGDHQRACPAATESLEALTGKTVTEPSRAVEWRRDGAELLAARSKERSLSSTAC